MMRKPQLITPNVYRQKERNTPLSIFTKGSPSTIFLQPKDHKIRLTSSFPSYKNKQETARVTINVLRISELKWTRMGEFNSDDHYINSCGQESLRRNGVDLIVNTRVQNAVLGWSFKNDSYLLFPRQAIHITVIQVYAQPLMPEKLKWNSSMKTYKTF